jgi:cell division protein FtsB
MHRGTAPPGALGDRMTIGRTVKRRTKAAIPPLVFLSLATYFAWSTTQGAHGLKAYAARQQDLVLAQSTLAGARAEQAAWEQRVSGLRNTHLDLDTLDERARAMLNLAEPNEIVVPYAQNQRLF